MILKPTSLLLFSSPYPNKLTDLQIVILAKMSHVDNMYSRELLRSLKSKNVRKHLCEERHSQSNMKNFQTMNRICPKLTKTMIDIR